MGEDKKTESHIEELRSQKIQTYKRYNIKIMKSRPRTLAGVNICPKYDIFAPPPISKNDIFSPRYSENFLLFITFPPLPHYIRAFS